MSSAPPRARRRFSRIHEGLVGARALIGTPYLDDPSLRREYTAEIAPRTSAALAKILGEVFAVGQQTDCPEHPRVLDLGAGTGSAGDAVRAHFGRGTRVVSVDRAGAHESSGGAGRGDQERVVNADLTVPGSLRLLMEKFDLVVAAHVLNELFIDAPLEQRIAARARLVAEWCGTLLEDGGTFIIVEPALRETSRELLAVRDQVVSAGLCVVAPCFWTGPCPALERERDWCHDSAARPESSPSPSQRPSARASLSRIDFSYLVLRQNRDAPTDPTLFRIVSDPLVEKGRLRFFGCGPVGRHGLVRLDRNRSDNNRSFDELERGDVVRLARTTYAGDGLRVVPETVVARGYVPTE